MKRPTIKRMLLIGLGVISFIVFVAVCPGLNFRLGNKYLGISRRTSESGEWQACAIGIGGYAVKYEWHAHENGSINGPKGFSTYYGHPYLRVGNAEFYTLGGR